MHWRWRRRSLIVAGTAIGTIAIGAWLAWTTGVVERHELYGAGHTDRGTFFNESQRPVVIGFLLICMFGAGGYALWYRWRLRRAIDAPKRSESPPA